MFVAWHFQLKYIIYILANNFAELSLLILEVTELTFA